MAVARKLQCERNLHDGDKFRSTATLQASASTGAKSCDVLLALCLLCLARAPYKYLFARLIYILSKRGRTHTHVFGRGVRFDSLQKAARTSVNWPGT
jgi:hypothetical protein